MMSWTIYFIILAATIVGWLALIAYEIALRNEQKWLRASRLGVRMTMMQCDNLVTHLNDALFTWDFPEAPSDTRIEQVLSRDSQWLINMYAEARHGFSKRV